jgi:hypothetical protein
MSIKTGLFIALVTMITTHRNMGRVPRKKTIFTDSRMEYA